MLVWCVSMLGGSLVARVLGWRAALAWEGAVLLVVLLSPQGRQAFGGKRGGTWGRFVLLAAVALVVPATAHADLFDTARQAVRTDLGRADMSGVTIRGGASLSSGLSPSSVTLLRGQGQVGGPCGSFDFATSLTQAFDELPDLFEALVGQVLQSVPMLALCYASPTLCDLAKHWQALVNMAVQAKYAQCQQIQMAMAYGGLRLRGGQISQCLEDEVANGRSITEALRTCNGDVTALRTPGGGRAPRVELMQDTLHAAGASPEMQTLARSLLGEVTLSANNGQLGTQQDRPQAAMLQRYEGHRQESDAALRQAIDALRATGQVSDATLQAVSVPGQPLPRAALEALATLQQDPVRYESLLQKLTTGLAITRLTWECTEVQEQLAGAIDANQELTDEQRRLLERRLAALQRGLHHVMAKKEVVERHLQPAVEALLQEYTAVQDSATRAGLRAPTLVPSATPYRTQQPSGYGQ
jgi:hypothetical protein